MKLGKKLLSLLTVLCLTLSLFPTMALATGETVNVGGISLSEGQYLVNSANDPVNDLPSDATGYIYFNASTKALELHNCNRVGRIYKSSGELKIALYGTNTITSDRNGIYSDGALTISGPGSLTLTAAQNTTIYAQDTITIQGGAKVTAPCGQDGQSIHLNEDNKEIIITGEDTEVTASNGSNSKAGEIRCGASSYSSNTYTGTIQLNDGAKLTATTINGTVKVNGTVQSNPSSSVTAPSTTSGYTVSGKVIDSRNSQPIAGASVQLRATGTSAGTEVIPTSTTTDDTGAYTFSNVPNGTYTITVSKDGYTAELSELSKAITVNRQNVTQDFSITPISYNVSVNGIPVTGANKDNVLNDANATVKYTPADGETAQKLTLNGAKIVNGTNGGITASNDLMIDLIGENTINATSNAIYLYHKTTEATSPKLTITSNQSGTLSMTSSNTSTTVYAYSGITINGSAKVNATINGTAQAIHSPNGNIIIGGTAEVTATNEYSTTSTINSIAVLVGTDSSPSGTIEVKDSASLKAQGHGKALGCTKFTYPANGYVAKGSTDYAPTNPGEYVANDLATYKYVEVKHEGATPTTFDVTLTNGTGYTLSATDSSSTPVTSGGSYSFTLDIADGYGKDDANFKVKANEVELTPDSNGVYKIEGIAKNQKITVEGVVKAYNVWVAGKQVTEANKDNVLNDSNSTVHSVTYTPATEGTPAKLTLTDAVINNEKERPASGSMHYILPNGITAKEELQIIVKGTENTITSKHGCAITSNKDLTICGDGSLMLNSQNDSNALATDYYSCTINIEESVKITATVALDQSMLQPVEPSTGMAIAAYNTNIQDAASVTAINHETNWAVYSHNQLIVKDSAILTARSHEKGKTICHIVDSGCTITASMNFDGNPLDGTYDSGKLSTTYKYVKVEPSKTVAVTNVTLDKTTLSMKVGESDTLTATVAPTNATNQAVTWTSSNEAVATVSNGTVNTVGVGTAIITVKTADGNKTASCTVTVTRASSSGGSHTTYYPVNTPAKSEGGSVAAGTKRASKGTTVTVTATAASGYQVAQVSAVDKDGKTVSLTDKGDGVYTFVMPASKVDVTARFAQVQKPEEKDPYGDVSKDSYYYDAVKWAAETGVTTGVGDGLFAPEWVCTRGQIVTFLWRASGSPAPKATELPFTDVAADAYYAQAVLWAVENGITNGTSETTFSPDQTCTRAHAVAFLYRMSGSPAAAGSTFSDVAADAYYSTAVAWAVEKGITNGTSGTTFSPDDTCTRGQIVTFLYRLAQTK